MLGQGSATSLESCVGGEKGRCRPTGAVRYTASVQAVRLDWESDLVSFPASCANVWLVVIWGYVRVACSQPLRVGGLERAGDVTGANFRPAGTTVQRFSEVAGECAHVAMLTCLVSTETYQLIDDVRCLQRGQTPPKDLRQHLIFKIECSSAQHERP